MPSLREYINTGENDENRCNGAIWRYWFFTVGSIGHTITSLKLKAWRNNSPGTFTVHIRAVSGTKPTGSDLTSGTYDGNSLGTSSPGSWVEIPVTELELSPNTTYAILVSTQYDDPNYLKWALQYGGSPTPDQQIGYSEDSGSSWTAQASNIAQNLYEVWGNDLVTAALHRFFSMF